MPRRLHLSLLHAETRGVIRHANAGQNERKLLGSTPAGHGARVPLFVFAAPSTKFSDTLTLSNWQVSVAGRISNVFSAMLDMESCFLLEKKEIGRIEYECRSVAVHL